MTTPTTNIGLSSIQTEFGGANPVSLSEYYRGGGTGYVPAGQATSSTDGVAVSASGTIRMGMFRGLTKAVTINLTIAANTTNYNIFSAAGSPAGVVTVNVTINAGVYVYGSTTGVYGMTTGSGWNAGSVINVTNAGVIAGFGGAGGAGGSSTAGGAGAGGGPAFQALRALSMTNNGTIAGGGGGGGGGGGYYDGKTYYQGGGGGGGRVGGAGGGPNGGAGSTTAAGGGGTGSYANGGAGGNFGAGAAGASSTYAGGGGGTQGAATSGGGNITYLATGTRLGTLG